MKITNTRLREIIREEADKLKSIRRLNETNDTIVLSPLGNITSPIPSSISKIDKIIIKVDPSTDVFDLAIRSIDKALSKFQSIGVLSFQSVDISSIAIVAKAKDNVLQIVNALDKNNLDKVSKFEFELFKYLDINTFKTFLAKGRAKSQPRVTSNDTDWLNTDLSMILDGDDHPLQNVYKPDPINITVEELLRPAIEEYSMDSRTANDYRIPYYDNDETLFKAFVSRLKVLLAVSKRSDAKMVKDFFNMLQYDTLMNAIVYFFQQPEDADFTDDSPGFEKELKIGKYHTTNIRRGYINDINALIKELQSNK